MLTPRICHIKLFLTLNCNITNISLIGQTGEGLDKPSIPPPTPPSPEESHYATPPMRMMPTVSEEVRVVLITQQT